MELQGKRINHNEIKLAIWSVINTNQEKYLWIKNPKRFTISIKGLEFQLPVFSTQKTISEALSEQYLFRVYRGLFHYSM